MITILFALFIIATIYAAVGHGGASGYLAILLLAGFAPESLRPLVLTMNIVVTSFLLLRMKLPKLEQQSFPLVLMAASIPAAFLGGNIQLDDSVYRFLLGALLIFSTTRLLIAKKDTEVTIKPKLYTVGLVGAGLGLTAGLTGIGGGVLLSPLLLLFRWSNIRQSIPIVGAFIWLNSFSGLAGWLFSGRGLMLVDQVFYLQALLVAFGGAILGSIWTTNFSSNKSLLYVLSTVLLVSGTKMILTAI